MNASAVHNGGAQPSKAVRSRAQSSDQIAEAEIEDQDKEFIQQYEEIQKPLSIIELLFIDV
jgi:hypothetical protein